MKYNERSGMISTNILCEPADLCSSSFSIRNELEIPVLVMIHEVDKGTIDSSTPGIISFSGTEKGLYTSLYKDVIFAFTSYESYEFNTHTVIMTTINGSPVNWNKSNPPSVACVAEKNFGKLVQEWLKTNDYTSSFKEVKIQSK